MISSGWMYVSIYARVESRIYCILKYKLYYKHTKRLLLEVGTVEAFLSSGSALRVIHEEEVEESLARGRQGWEASLEVIIRLRSQ